MRFVIAGALAVSWVAIWDLVLLGAHGHLIAMSLSLFFLLALVQVGWIAGAELLALRASGLGKRTLIRTLAALPILLLMSWRLFDGSYAGTLVSPGLGRWVALLVGHLLVAGAILSGAMLHKRWGRLPIALLVGAALVANEFVCRSGALSGYEDLEAASGFIAIALAAVMGLVLLPPSRAFSSNKARVGGVIALLVLVVSSVGTLARSLRSPSDRWALALSNTHSKHLVTLIKRGFDDDHDGYASILGGGDCDDSSSSIHPSAQDIPGNGRDENCDGVDASGPSRHSDEFLAYDERLAMWQTSSPAREDLARFQSHDVVVILIDTLRADLLENTELNRRDFPRLFELTDQSRRFRHAFSPGSGTDLAMGTLLTGRIDPFVEIRTTLFEAIAASGRTTLGVFPREVLRWAGRTLITRGLNEVREIATDRDTPDVGSHSASMETTNAGLELLRGSTGLRRFLWMHFFDVHEHLQLPRSASGLVGLLPWQPEDDSERVIKYRATLKLVDQAIGHFMDELRKSGAWDRTIVVLASDHGESMLEDERLPKAHGLYVYEPLVRIPLAIRIPGVEPATIDTPVALADLTKTLLALSGASPIENVEAHTLVHHLLPEVPDDIKRMYWPILLHEQKQWGIIVWPHKLMVREEDNLRELYNLEVDPREKRDLSMINPEMVRALEELRHRYPPFRLIRTRDSIAAREVLAMPPP